MRGLGIYQVGDYTWDLLEYHAKTQNIHGHDLSLKYIAKIKTVVQLKLKLMYSRRFLCTHVTAK